MKRLFLTSSVGTPGIASSIRARLGHKRPLRTAFITTSVETREETKDLTWYFEDRSALKSAGFDFFDYTLTGKKISDFEKDLKDIEAIYVSGGNTLYLLQQAQLTGFIPYIQKRVKKGLVYVGTSAGSIIAGPDVYPTFRLENADDAPLLKNYIGFSLVDFCILPHWGSDHFKELYLNRRLEHSYHPKWELILLNDNQYVEVKDDWYRIVDITKE